MLSPTDIGDLLTDLFARDPAAALAVMAKTLDAAPAALAALDADHHAFECASDALADLARSLPGGGA